MLLGGFLPWAWDTASALVQRAGWAPEQCEITVSIAFIALQFMAATLLGLPWALLGPINTALSEMRREPLQGQINGT